MTGRERANSGGYDTYAHHLLCVAVANMAAYVAKGYECFLFAETYQGRFTVYYMAHRLVRPTRRERGCYLAGGR